MTPTAKCRAIMPAAQRRLPQPTLAEPQKHDPDDELRKIDWHPVDPWAEDQDDDEQQRQPRQSRHHAQPHGALT